MRIYTNIIFEIFCLIAPCVCMAWDPINGNYTFGNNVNTDEEIHITGSGTITNYGTLHGTIIIDSGLAVTFQNFGEINSNFNVGGTATVTQNVTSENDLHALGNLTGYNVYVDTRNLDGTKNRIDMAEFITMISGASNVEVQSAEFIVGTNVPDNNVPINVNNSTTLYLTGLPNDLSKPVVRGISGTPFVETVGIDPMYDVTVNWYGSDLYLSVVRQTDYSAIMPDNNLGNYLDELRDKNPNDKLLSALDAAPDRASMNRILSKSVRLNPIKSMDAVRSINTFYDSFAIDDIAFGFIARPFYIHSNDFHFVGGAANVTGKIVTNTVGTIGINGGMLKYNGDYDEYSGTLYGGNIGVRYMDDDFYLRVFGVVSYANFSDINAFDGVRMLPNVNGISGMGAFDVGLVYHAMNELKLIPFVGARIDYASVLNDANIDAAARAGLNLGIDTGMDGNKYKFGARILGQTDGAFYAGIYTDMISTADGVGGGASVGIMYDNMGLSYKLELNIKFEF